MRNLNECQAEVFRRSEKRIKERRARRNHILMACIPLVLCVTIFGGLFLPNLDDFKRAPESSDELLYSGTGTEAVGGLFTGSIEVSGNGVFNYYTAVADVQGINALLNGIVAIPETAPDGGGRDFVTEDSSSIDLKENANANEQGYTIVVKRSDGSSTEYLLVGSVLINQATQQEYPVSEDTMKDLKNALGIPLN